MSPTPRHAGRRAFLTGGLALVTVAAACAPDPNRGPDGAPLSGGDGAGPTRQPSDDPAPRRTVDRSRPATRVAALSSSDLDCLQALGVTPAVAWTGERVMRRPWHVAEPPATPDWDGPGLPPLDPLLPFAADAIALTGADPTAAQLRTFEQIAPVVAASDGQRPAWREQLSLLAVATRRADVAPRTIAAGVLDRWARRQRELGVTRFAVMHATGALPDTPVATLAADAPLCRELRALGFDVLARAEPTPYRDLRLPGVQTVRVDPRDDDLRLACDQPSVLALPWALTRLTENRRPV